MTYSELWNIKTFDGIWISVRHIAVSLENSSRLYLFFQDATSKITLHAQLDSK